MCRRVRLLDAITAASVTPADTGLIHWFPNSACSNSGRFAIKKQEIIVSIFTPQHTLQDTGSTWAHEIQHVKITPRKDNRGHKEKAEILSWPFCVSLLSNSSLSTNGLEASADSLILAKVGQLPPTMITPSRKCSLFPHRTPIWPPRLWHSQACGGFSNKKNSLWLLPPMATDSYSPLF